MHTLEPYYAWRNHYVASNDPRSPFLTGPTASLSTRPKSTITSSIRSGTPSTRPPCFAKSFVDYDERFAIIEFIGEWNDCLYNDIMQLKREVIDVLMAEGIHRYILIGENVLNFHFSDDCYYEEWFDEVTEDDGWIALLNFREHVIDDMKAIDLDSYFVLGGELSELGWRTFSPANLYQRIDDCVNQRLGLIG